MNALHTRLAAALSAACITYLTVGSVVSLAGNDPRAQEKQFAKAQAQIAAVATAAPAARGEKL